MKINLFVNFIKRCCWLFLKIIDPSDLTSWHLYYIKTAFCIPHDNSPCIKYKYGMHGLQKEKWENMFSS